MSETKPSTDLVSGISITRNNVVNKEFKEIQIKDFRNLQLGIVNLESIANTLGLSALTRGALTRFLLSILSGCWIIGLQMASRPDFVLQNCKTANLV